jgi:DNA invertase Pin-like site-specific DNA recombinase
VKRAILYARVSTEKRSQRQSVRRQIEELRNLAKLRGWQVIAAKSDRLSGGSRDRPGLSEALDLIFAGRADLLVVHDLDRLGRDVRNMLENVDAIHEAGGNFFVRDRNIDTSSPGGRLTFVIFAALAEYQRNENRLKVIAGLEYARKKGVRLGRPPAIPPLALARAVELRRQRPRPSWRTIVTALHQEKRGRFAKGTVAGAVTRAMRPRPGRAAL